MQPIFAVIVVELLLLLLDTVESVGSLGNAYIPYFGSLRSTIKAVKHQRTDRLGSSRLKRWYCSVTDEEVKLDTDEPETY